MPVREGEKSRTGTFYGAFFKMQNQPLPLLIWNYEEKLKQTNKQTNRRNLQIIKSKKLINNLIKIVDFSDEKKSN